MCVYKWISKEDAWKSLSALPGEFQRPHQVWIKCKKLKRSNVKQMDLCLTLHVLVILADFLLPLYHWTCLSGIPLYMLVSQLIPSAPIAGWCYHCRLYLRLWAISVKSGAKEELKPCISLSAIASYLFLEEQSDWDDPVCCITSLVKSVNESSVKAE